MMVSIRLLALSAAAFSARVLRAEGAKSFLRGGVLVDPWVPPEPMPYSTSWVERQRLRLEPLQRQASTTIVSVGSQGKLLGSIASATVLQFVRDIPLVNASHEGDEDTGVALSGFYDLVLSGNGHRVDGLDRRRCFYITGSTTEVTFYDMEIVNCVADNQTATQAPLDIGAGRGAGLYVSNGATITMRNITIARCHAKVFGGGLFVFNGVTLTMASCNVTSNAQYQGALYVWSYCTVRLKDCTISDNTAEYGCGLLITTHIDLTVEDSFLLNNSVPSGGGGGLYIYLSVVKLIRSVVSGSYGRFAGGMNLGMGARCYIEGSSISSNVATGHGGGVAVDNSALLVAVNSVIADNSAGWGGGILLDASGAAQLDGSFVQGNVALTGGGVYISGSASSLSMVGGGLVRNTATGDSGGGGVYVASGTVRLKGSQVAGNSALGPTFELKSGNCTTGGGCFYSANFPSDYIPNDACTFVAGADGVLEVVAFNTELSRDYLEIHGVQYNGIYGPDGVAVQAGDSIRFVSSADVVSSGFQVCFKTASSGGGIFVQGGFVDISAAVLSKNIAVRHGGAIFIEGGDVEVVDSSILDNTAARGDGLFLNSGSFNSVGLSLRGAIDGSSIGAAACHSPCLAGSTGVCRLVEPKLAPRCFVDCTCEDCPAGTASHFIGATSSGSCVSCGSGQVSAAGATQCSSCPAGTYATDDPRDASGGLIHQVPVGALYCIKCPPGTFSATTSAIVCLRCPFGLSSSHGSTECSLAADGFYIDIPVSSRTTDSVVTEKCPDNAKCPGGDVMPMPDKGNWVARNDMRFASYVYPCPFNTCTQPSTSSTDGAACWSLAQNFSSNISCSQCAPGSEGPLCGACAKGFKLSSSDLECVECTSERRPLLGAIVVVTLLVVGILAAVLYFKGVFPGSQSLSLCMEWCWLRVVRAEASIPLGADRVLISNYQIIQGMSWTLGIKFPGPSGALPKILSVLNLDFFTFGCLFGTPDHLVEVLLWAAAPIGLSAVNFLVYIVRNQLLPVHERKEEERHENLVNLHVLVFLRSSYFILPVICRQLLGTFYCIEVADHMYLKVDTAIDCESRSYSNTVKVIELFLALYLSVPLMWMIFLLRKKEWLTPARNESPDSAKDRRDRHKGVGPFRFLFEPYKMHFFGLEVFEMYRRVFFIGVLPLVSQSSGRKAALGIFAALASLVIYREMEPFESDVTNILATVCHLTVLVDFGAALAISSDLVDGLDAWAFGAIILAANCLVLGLTVSISVSRLLLEKSARWRFHSALSTQDYAMIQSIMEAKGLGFDDNFAASISTSSSIEMNSSSQSTKQAAIEQEVAQAVLRQHLLDPNDVKFFKKVGAGSFGEVFEGSLLGERVAIKTIKNVSGDAARAFRAEILLNATLRHLNIVAFVGACWGRDLVGLVLEWCPRGNLDDVLQVKAQSFTWNEPLLRLATDIARGMAYLHGREYYDEASMTRKKCIIHRDLKPSNVMVTEFLCGKIGDFGTSRAKDAATITAAGTPLFAAPELMRGERFDESVDVYSFGMTLLDLAVEQDLATFVAERWRATLGAGMAIPNPRTISFNAVLRPIWDDGWRPFSERSPSEVAAWAPASIFALIARCCTHDPKARPTFDGILDELKGPCAAEMDEGAFYRKGGAGRLRLSAHEARNRASEAGPAVAAMAQQLNPMIAGGQESSSAQFRRQSAGRESL